MNVKSSIVGKYEIPSGYTYLLKADVGGVFAEALTADVEVIFADQTSLVSANTAVSFVINLKQEKKEKGVNIIHINER